jgi:predicted 3-demethylubiquinone-9 3-methyltransferase (glyoxalase superfamily)
VAKLNPSRISQCLWFDGQAEEAAKFYVSIFKQKSKVKSVTRYGKTGPGKEGSVMTVAFDLAGEEFIGLNAGPEFKFNPAISFMVNCKNQKEVDYFWEKLKAGGKEVQCGWLTDKFGVSWQVVPTLLLKLHLDKDKAVREAVMAQMMKMVKLDIEPLKRAAEGARKAKTKKKKS